MTTLLFLADDDLDDIELFCEAVHEVDASVRMECSCDGLELLDKLINRTTQLPETIFLDVNMPRMNGWQCLVQLKEQPDLQHIPVILYSTSSLPQEKRLAIERGAQAFITKPSDYKDLKKMVRKVLDGLRTKVQ